MLVLLLAVLTFSVTVPKVMLYGGRVHSSGSDQHLHLKPGGRSAAETGLRENVFTDQSDFRGGFRGFLFE